MKRTETSLFHTELSSRDIRAVTARLAHPDDPLAEWRFEFEEWRKAYAEFQQMEQEQIIQVDAPSALARRRHRYVLFLLMAQGEHLALALMQAQSISETEQERLLDSVDAFLGSLRDSWHTWHGETLPKHRQALTPHLSPFPSFH